MWTRVWANRIDLQAQSLHVPNQAINVQYTELKKLYNLSVDEIKNILKYVLTAPDNVIISR